jgi:bifunctional ADP-heptose synthase (sugar kinase/adenylyltransferase)
MGRSELDNIKKEYTIEHLSRVISQFKKLRVLVMGDSIIDEYHFTSPKGRATKDPMLSVDYVRHETYAGGILAVARHISDFVDQVTCVTLLGDHEDKKNFIVKCMSKNVSLKFFVKENSPTTIKKRYLSIAHNEKLFKVEHINDVPISGALEQEFIDYLENELPKYDIVFVGDFGHGLVTEKIIKVLEEKAKYLAVNAQSNSTNLGFNYVTRYNFPTLLTMDIQELMYAVEDRFSSVPVLMNKLYDKTHFNKFLVTMSKNGSGFFNAGKQTFFPAFVMRPEDTVGAGDAVFSIIPLFDYCKCGNIIPFVANCVGGIAVSYMGNKSSITKGRLIEFIEQVYNGDKKIS